MLRKKYTPENIIFKLSEAEVIPEPGGKFSSSDSKMSSYSNVAKEKGKKRIFG